MIRARLIVVCLLVISAFVAAGCGGGSSSSGSSKAEFLKQANAICAKTRAAVLKKLRTYNQEHPGRFESLEPEIEKDRLVMDLAHPLVQEEAKRLSQLPAPDGDEEKIAAIVAALEAGLKKAEEDPLSTIAGTYRRAINLATAYGLRACYEIV